MKISLEVRESNYSEKSIQYAVDFFYSYGASEFKFRSLHSKDDLIEIKELMIQATTQLEDFIKKIEE